MTNPYDDLPEVAFWKLAMAATGGRPGLPAPARRFVLGPKDLIATAGSCFAQNVAKFLRGRPTVSLIEAETLLPEDPIFSGRYGNVYTARQMVELLDEIASGTADPSCAIRRRDGRFVDAYRPFMEPDGFADADAVVAARQAHVAALAPAFAQASLFVFTLGLTEAWRAPGGRVYPVCPGVYSDDPAHPFVFVNYDYPAVLADIEAMVARLQALNPSMKVLLTVSPVPLTATFSGDHVLTATTQSKSVLRAAAGAAAAAGEVYYFPSFELIANPFAPGTAYADNLRSVSQAPIDRIMAEFEAVYLEGGAPRLAEAGALSLPSSAVPSVAMADNGPPEDVVCDDVEIENSMGF